MAQWCDTCGTPSTGASLCAVCGSASVTDVEPSDQPCAYCGHTPTWQVVWRTGSGDDERACETWLCASCDDRETEALSREDGGSDFEDLQHLAGSPPALG